MQLSSLKKKQQYKQCTAGLAAETACVAALLTTNRRCKVLLKQMAAQRQSKTGSLTAPEACSSFQRSGSLLAVPGLVGLQEALQKKLWSACCKSWQNYSSCSIIAVNTCTQETQRTILMQQHCSS